jgi:hypothetical protein
VGLGNDNNYNNNLNANNQCNNNRRSRGMATVGGDIFTNQQPRPKGQGMLVQKKLK